VVNDCFGFGGFHITYYKQKGGLSLLLVVNLIYETNQLSKSYNSSLSIITIAPTGNFVGNSLFIVIVVLVHFLGVVAVRIRKILVVVEVRIRKILAEMEELMKMSLTVMEDQTHKKEDLMSQGVH